MQLDGAGGVEEEAHGQEAQPLRLFEVDRDRHGDEAAARHADTAKSWRPVDRTQRHGVRRSVRRGRVVLRCAGDRQMPAVAVGDDDQVRPCLLQVVARDRLDGRRVAGLESIPP
ncbi:MAG: hypothetical protein R2708_27760 [Vicinamibacterales bacterium]